MKYLNSLEQKWNKEEEKNIEDISYWFNKIDNAKKDKALSILFQKHHKRINIFQYAPKSIQENEEIILKAYQDDMIFLHNVSDNLMKKKDFIKKCMKDKKFFYYWSIQDYHPNDEELFFLAYKNNYMNVQNITKELYTQFNLEKQQKLLEINPLGFEYFPNKWKENPENILFAIRLEPRLIKFCKKIITQKILRDKMFCVNLIEKNMEVFPYCHISIRKDQKLSEKVLSRKPYFFKYIGKNLKNNKEFIKNYLFVPEIEKYINKDFFQDSEILKKYLKYHPFKDYQLKTWIDHQTIEKHMINNIEEEGPSIYRFCNSKNNWKYIAALLKYETYTEMKDGFKVTKTILDLIPLEVLQLIEDEYHKEKLENSNIVFLDFMRGYIWKKVMEEDLQKANINKKHIKI